VKDSDKCKSKDVFIGNGASEGCRLSLMAVIRNDTDGVLVPIPQYPLYSAQLTLQKGHLLPYFLDEDKNWAVDVKGIEN
jgi:aspartate/methionine/tyrosine aminotransferase